MAFAANVNGDGEVIALGRDDQTTLAAVPHHIEIEDVEFSSNVIRSASSAFNILGHDDTVRSGQLARLLIRNNLAYDIHAGNWGGTGTFAQIGGEPRDITIDHNTVLHTGNIVLFYSGSYLNASGVKVTGGPILGFVFTNNMAKHNGYGIFGSGQSSGTVSLAYYAPGSVVRRNVLASDKSVASRYPPDNFFPTVANFTAGFVDPSNRDYRLVSSSPYLDAGTDGQDIGCIFAPLCSISSSCGLTRRSAPWPRRLILTFPSSAVHIVVSY